MPSAAACVARGRTKLELAAENVKYQRRAEAAEAERDRLREALKRVKAVYTFTDSYVDHLGALDAIADICEEVL